MTIVPVKNHEVESAASNLAPNKDMKPNSLDCNQRWLVQAWTSGNVCFMHATSAEELLEAKREFTLIIHLSSPNYDEEIGSRYNLDLLSILH